MAFVHKTFTVWIDGFGDVSKTKKGDWLEQLATAITNRVFQRYGVLPVAIGIHEEEGAIALTFEDVWIAEYVARRQNQLETEWINAHRD